MPAQLDLAALGSALEVTVKSAEHDDDRVARLAREDRDSRAESIKGHIVFGVFMLAIIALGGLCAYRVFFDAAAPDEAKRWAQQFLLAMISGVASFIAGRKIGSK
jgi:hypothetical protein